MTIMFAQETYERIVDEILPLLPKHWEELAVYKDVPLEPDYDLYEKAAKAEKLVIYAARLDGALIGYSIFSVHARHPHYSSLKFAINDIVWIHPSFRERGFGRAFRDFWDKALYDLGVGLAVIDTKVSHPALRFLLEDGGYTVRSAGLEKRLR